MSTFVEQFK